MSTSSKQGVVMSTTPGMSRGTAKPMPRIGAPGGWRRQGSRVDVHWTGQDDLPRAGRTTLTGRHRSGDTVEVWADPDDRLVAAPPGTQDAVIAAVLTWLFGTAVSVAGVAGPGRVLLAWTWWRLRRAWELEWEQVEPQWAGRSGQ